MAPPYILAPSFIGGSLSLTSKLFNVVLHDKSIKWDSGLDDAFSRQVSILLQDFWQKRLDKLEPEVTEAINYGLNFAQGVIKGFGTILNDMIASESADTFVFDVKNMPLNFTMTKAPIFDSKADEIMIHVDGMFTNPNMTQYVEVNTDKWMNYTS